MCLFTDVAEKRLQCDANIVAINNLSQKVKETDEWSLFIRYDFVYRDVSK